MINNKAENRKNEEWEYPDYIVYQQLINTRDWWSPQLVDEFLPIPAKTAPNPHNLSQTMRLYKLKHVYRVEDSSAFKKRVLELNRKSVSYKAFVKMKNELRKQENAKARDFRKSGFKGKQLLFFSTLDNQNEVQSTKEFIDGL